MKAISSVWTEADVSTVANDLTSQQCQAVLCLLKTEHDADVGINWLTIKYWTDMVRGYSDVQIKGIIEANERHLFNYDSNINV